MMRDVGGSTAILSAAHFLVDLCCIFLETAFILAMVPDRGMWMWCVLIYNFFAFACQLPVGIFGDRQEKPWLLAGTGCFLIAAAYLIAAAGNALSGGRLLSPDQATAAEPAVSVVLPVLVSVIAGLGNSCFHVGGGIRILKEVRGSAALPGIFVSTGAFGVWLGPVLAGQPAARRLGLAFGILLMALCGYILCREERGNSFRRAGKISYSALRTGYTGGRSAGAPIAALCLVAAVLLRSYAGTIMKYGWKKGMLAFLFTAGVVFGKMLGGILGDRIGWMRTAAGSLALSGVLFLFAEKIPLCGILAVFFFNMTMPLTLTALAEQYRNAEGMAFGMTTLALFLGTLPAMGTAAGILPAQGPRLLLPLCLVSMVLMAAGLWPGSRRSGVFDL